MSFTITNPFTGKPLEKTPDGTSLKDVTFETKEEALQFFKDHGGNPVEMVEVPNKEGLTLPASRPPTAAAEL